MPDPLPHIHYLSLCLRAAENSPPKPTNFRVGACFLSPSTSSQPLVTGYTLECPGNTHAEQSCITKLAEQYGCTVEDLGQRLPKDAVLYTTMEPCNKRSVGNVPCVERILALKRVDGSQAVRKVICGVSEPQTFVGVNEGKKKLEEAGIEVVVVEGMEDEILMVATAGHEKDR